MEKRVVLHIGMHKTGTSSIQAAIQGYDDGRTRVMQLGGLNHMVPSQLLFAPDPFTYSGFKKRGLTRAELEGKQRKIEAAFAAELASPHETLIMTSERMSMAGPEMVAATQARIAAAGRRLEVIGYARAPIGFASAEIAQRAKRGSLSFRRPSPRYALRFGPWVRLMPPEALTILRYDPAGFTEGSVVADFAERLGLDRGKLSNPRDNATASRGAVKLAWAFSRSMPLSEGRPELHDARLALNAALEAEIEGPRFEIAPGCLPSAPEVMEDATWLADKTGIDFRAALVPVQDMLGQDQLGAEMRKIAPDDAAQLDAMLARRGLPGRRGLKLDQKLAHLYFHFLLDAR